MSVVFKYHLDDGKRYTNMQKILYTKRNSYFLWRTISRWNTTQRIKTITLSDSTECLFVKYKYYQRIETVISSDELPITREWNLPIFAKDEEEEDEHEWRFAPISGTHHDI